METNKCSVLYSGRQFTGFLAQSSHLHNEAFKIILFEIDYLISCSSMPIIQIEVLSDSFSIYPCFNKHCEVASGLLLRGLEALLVLSDMCTSQALTN